MFFHTGCPIWSFKGWGRNLYPRGTKPADFLHEYTRGLTTIEGNTAFYAVPEKKTIESWVDNLAAPYLCRELHQCVARVEYMKAGCNCFFEQR
jgi:hypothetical protein